MSRSVGRRCGLDLALLCLWCRPAAAAPIGPLAWEPPYAAGVALKKSKKKPKNKQTKKPKQQQQQQKTPNLRESVASVSKSRACT